MGRVAWEKNQTSYARSLPLFKDWDTLKEHKKIISKGKVVTMNSILGYYPYTLFQTLLLSTQDNRRWEAVLDNEKSRVLSP